MRKTIFSSTILGLGLLSAIIPVYASTTTHFSHISGRVETDIIAHWTNVPSKTLELWKSLTKKYPNTKVIMNSDNSVTTVIAFPMQKGTVLVNGKPVPVNNGVYSTDVSSNSASVELDYKNKNIMKDTLNLSSQNNTENIVRDVDWGTFIKSMDSTGQSGNSTNTSMPGMNMSNTTALPNATTPGGGGGCDLGPYPYNYSGQHLTNGVHVHCDRMNGTVSDNTYWPDYAPQAWGDYLGSDCYHNESAWGCSFTGDNQCDGLGRNNGGGCAYDCSLNSGDPITFHSQDYS